MNEAFAFLDALKWMVIGGMLTVAISGIAFVLMLARLLNKRAR